MEVWECLFQNIFGLDDELDRIGVFDCVLNNDSRFFINLMRLKVSDVPEFKGAYQRINDYFSEIATLLNASDSKEDKLYKTAFKRFMPLEINGINLGFSESKHGAAFGEKLRRQVISDAFDIVKKGILYPEVFQLVSLFEESIGPDRLSDMISTIIYLDIVAYTKRNPYKGCEILFLPIDILHELPIAQCWDDIDRVVSENENIRREINEAIGQEWSRWYAGDKKAYLKEYIFKDPERCARVIEGYKKSEIEKYDLNLDIDYFVEKLIKTMKKAGIHFAVENAKRKNSFEPDAGRGPVDLKVSRGGDKTIVEIKLSTNDQYLHGYEEQVKEYGRAECTDKMIYVFIDLGNPGRLKKLTYVHTVNIKNYKKVPELLFIDATAKVAASTYSK